MQSPASPSPSLRAVPAPLLTVQQAAARMRVSKATVYRLCAEGRLQYVRVSTQSIRISEGAVTDYLVRAAE